VSGASNDRMIVNNESESAERKLSFRTVRFSVTVCEKELRLTALNLGPVSPFLTVVRNGLFRGTKEGRYSVSQLAALISAVRC
jgi:hypothetical protein